MKKLERLWTPWRMQYIKNAVKTKACIFCKKLKEKDSVAYVVKKTKYSFSMLNIYPYNNGHVMVAPKRHIARLNLLSAEERTDLIELVSETQSLLEKKCKPHGFNIGINSGRVAGAGVVGHLHFHIVPRWDGDTNFMPIIGETKVIAQLLEETYRELIGK